ncbi:MAG: hypothetical protein R3C28_28405 [Pirellulaceae bacterium]
MAEELEIRDLNYGGAEDFTPETVDLGYLVATPDDFDIAASLQKASLPPMDPALELAIARELGLAVPDANDELRLLRPLAHRSPLSRTALCGSGFAQAIPSNSTFKFTVRSRIRDQP